MFSMPAVAITCAAPPSARAGGRPCEAQLPPAGKWIEVNLATQTLTACRGRHSVRTMPISSGAPPHWTTPNGTFWIYKKLREDRMRGEDPHRGEHWDVAHVPFVQYFNGPIAIHGAPWNHHLGRPRSHGCIQLSTLSASSPDPDDARWLYHYTRIGTQVMIVGTTPGAETNRPLDAPLGSIGSPTAAMFDASSSR